MSKRKQGQFGLDLPSKRDTDLAEFEDIVSDMITVINGTDLRPDHKDVIVQHYTNFKEQYIAARKQTRNPLYKRYLECLKVHLPTLKIDELNFCFKNMYDPNCPHIRSQNSNTHGALVEAHNKLMSSVTLYQELSSQRDTQHLQEHISNKIVRPLLEEQGSLLNVADLTERMKIVESSIRMPPKSRNPEEKVVVRALEKFSDAVATYGMNLEELRKQEANKAIVNNNLVTEGCESLSGWCWVKCIFVIIFVLWLVVSQVLSGYTASYDLDKAGHLQRIDTLSNFLTDNISDDVPKVGKNRVYEISYQTPEGQALIKTGGEDEAVNTVYDIKRFQEGYRRVLPLPIIPSSEFFTHTKDGPYQLVTLNTENDSETFVPLPIASLQERLPLTDIRDSHGAPMLDGATMVRQAADAVDRAWHEKITKDKQYSAQGSVPEEEAKKSESKLTAKDVWTHMRFHPESTIGGRLYQLALLLKEKKIVVPPGASEKTLMGIAVSSIMVTQFNHLNKPLLKEKMDSVKTQLKNGLKRIIRFNNGKPKCVHEIGLIKVPSEIKENFLLLLKNVQRYKEYRSITNDAVKKSDAPIVYEHSRDQLRDIIGDGLVKEYWQFLQFFKQLRVTWSSPGAAYQKDPLEAHLEDTLEAMKTYHTAAENHYQLSTTNAPNPRKYFSFMLNINLLGDLYSMIDIGSKVSKLLSYHTGTWKKLEDAAVAVETMIEKIERE